MFGQVVSYAHNITLVLITVQPLLNNRKLRFIWLVNKDYLISLILLLLILPYKCTIIRYSRVVTYGVQQPFLGGSGWGIISSQGRLVLCMIVVGTLWFLYDLREVRRQHRWCVFHVSLEGRQRHGCNTVKTEEGIEERQRRYTMVVCVQRDTHTQTYTCKEAKKEEWQVSNADGSGKHPLNYDHLTVCLDLKNGSIFHQNHPVAKVSSQKFV